MKKRNPPSLKTLQEAFEKSIFHLEDSINQWVASDNRGDAEKRMAIYRFAYRARLKNVLLQDYPTLHQILGDEMFSEACEAYLKVYPSTSYTVRHFGRHMSTFLRQTRPYSSHLYLAEMAEFEWQKGLCFDGSDAAIVSLETFSNLSEQDIPFLRFKFVPTLRLMQCEYDTPTLWMSFNNDHAEELSMPIKLKAPISWAMWRKNNSPTWQSLDIDHAWALNSAMQGATFLTLCDGLREWIDEAHIPHRISEFIQLWFNEKMVNKIELK